MEKERNSLLAIVDHILPNTITSIVCNSLCKYYNIEYSIIDNIATAKLHERYGFKYWNLEKYYAARSRSLELVKYFVSKGATHLNYVINHIKTQEIKDYLISIRDQ